MARGPWARMRARAARRGAGAVSERVGQGIGAGERRNGNGARVSGPRDMRAMRGP
jgi:hypothetical protein